MSLLDALDNLTDVTQALFRATNTKVTCGAKCGACCYEPVYATLPEAQLIIDTIRDLPNGDAGIEMVKLAVAHWLKTFEASDLHHQDEPKAIEYRALFLGCPFLTPDQNCDVYAVRPSGCRMFFTTGHPSWCGNLEQRPKQEYVDVMGTAMVTPPLMEAVLGVARASMKLDPDGESDHLGIMLAEALGLDPKPSGARTNRATIQREQS